MSPADFLHALEEVLRQRRISFSRDAAIVFVECCWPLIEDNPDPWYWSNCFCETGAAAGEVASECPPVASSLTEQEEK
jgi:hypothetical protein